MAVQREGSAARVVEFAPKNTNMSADDVGNGIMARMQEASESARQDCERAMDLAHKLTMQLRAVEERAAEFEGEANYFRDRAANAEKWLAIIHKGVEQTFFQEK